MEFILRKIVILLLSIIVAIPECYCHSIYSESNYFEAPYSALIKVVSYRSLKVDSRELNFEEPYLVQAEIIELYHGEVPKNFEYVYWGPPGDTPQTEGLIGNQVLLSFCKSSKDRYYVYENHAHIPATVENINEFRIMSKADSDDDNHKCRTNFPKYNPDNYESLK